MKKKEQIVLMCEERRNGKLKIRGFSCDLRGFWVRGGEM